MPKSGQIILEKMTSLNTIKAETTKERICTGILETLKTPVDMQRQRSTMRSKTMIMTNQDFHYPLGISHRYCSFIYVSTSIHAPSSHFFPPPSTILPEFLSLIPVLTVTMLYHSSLFLPAMHSCDRKDI